MRFLFILLVFCCDLSAKWPKAEKIKIIIPTNASMYQKKLAEEMAAFFSSGDSLSKEDMIVDDLYADKFFTYYVDDFLIILGNNNRLQRFRQRGVKLSGVAPFYTEQGTFDSHIAYLGLSVNPLFLKGRFIGMNHGSGPASVSVGGSNDRMLRHAWQQLKRGWVQGTWSVNSNAVERDTDALWGQMQLRDFSLKKNENDLLVRKYFWEGGKLLMKFNRVDKLGRLQELD